MESPFCDCSHEMSEHYEGAHNCMRYKCECKAFKKAVKPHPEQYCACRGCEAFNALGYYR